MSSNAAIARRLALMAQMLDLLGEDSFRSSAHARASRAIEDWPADLHAIVRENAAGDTAKARLMEIDGIGAKMADKIIEFVRTGRIAEGDELAARVPQGLLELLRVPGLGPKTVRAMWTELGIVDVASLKAKIADGSLRSLPRMGQKAVDKIAASLDLLGEADRRLHIGPASVIAESLVGLMKSIPGVADAAYAGSLRRGRETVGDIDVLVATGDPAAARAAGEAFRTMPGVTTVLAAGESKSSVRVAVARDARWDDGQSADAAGGGQTVQVDLRIVHPDAFGAALMYFTGSKEHNVAMRQRALSMGLTLNEYGLFPEDSASTEPPQSRGVRPVAARTEQEVFAKLGLPWIPPELREGQGDVASHVAPRQIAELVDVPHIRAELHAHTTASDGVLSIIELATRAKARGFHTIAVTDHSRSSTIARGLDSGRLREHIKAIHAARQQIDGITILAGSEVDILADGSLDYDDDLLAQLDIVVASPHAALSQDPATATARLLKAIQHPATRILGHPTGRLVLRRQGLEPAMDELFAAAAEHDVAMEINAHWMRLDLRDTHARRAIELGCMLAINCDVHSPGDYDNLRFGVMTARRAGAPAGRVVNTLDHDTLHKWLRREVRLSPGATEAELGGKPAAAPKAVPTKAAKAITPRTRSKKP